MTAEYLVLLVEDENSQISNFDLNLSEFHAENKHIHFKWIAAKTAEDAEQILRERRIDCAILDLRIPEKTGGKPNDVSGNRLGIKILEENGIPLVVHSGNLKGLEEKLETYNLILILREPGSFRKALDKLSENSGFIDVLRGVRTEIRFNTSTIFMKYIWRRWETYSSNKEIKGDLVHLITRQVIGHLNEAMTLESYASPLFHGLEFYFVPPIREENLHTGDLLKIRDKVWVIVTPQCDMATTKVSHIFLAECEPMGEEWEKLVKDYSEGDEGKKNKIEEKVKKLTNQKRDISKHFIPCCGEDGPWLVNFQKVRSVPIGRLECLKKFRFASISFPFIPNLTQRFASYLGRIGQPNIDPKHLL